ncbi:hypothetical protein GPL21_28525 [Bradyrhizobium pachyrhizi]|uniref:Uncharacterized protein n=1 Tax=Bradyrhizobium pachyrhizi TaxID=280333 RepID=A0A844T1U4_9BRAD|nr:hypothetical protein [Bradyrhizobium pachyrhizi]
MPLDQFAAEQQPDQRAATVIDAGRVAIDEGRCQPRQVRLLLVQQVDPGGIDRESDDAADRIDQARRGHRPQQPARQSTVGTEHDSDGEAQQANDPDADRIERLTARDRHGRRQLGRQQFAGLRPQRVRRHTRPGPDGRLFVQHQHGKRRQQHGHGEDRELTAAQAHRQHPEQCNPEQDRPDRGRNCTDRAEWQRRQSDDGAEQPR